MSTPKAVLFDVGNTLVSYYRRDEFAPVLESCVHNALAYLRDHGLVFEPAVVLESAWQYNTEREDLTVVALEERLAALFSLRTTDHPLMPGLVAAFMAPNLALARAAPDALATLQALKARGIVVGVISNTPWGSDRHMWSAQLHDLGLAYCIDHQVFCMDVGVRKPHPAIFEHALEIVGVSAEEALFVGDDPVWDVMGAQQVNMAVLLYDPHDDTSQPAGAAAVPVIHRLAEILGYLDQARYRE